MDNATETVTAATIKVSSVATYGGAGSAIFFGLTANEFGALCGIGIGLAGLIANIWFKYQHLKLARLEASQSKK